MSFGALEFEGSVEVHVDGVRAAVTGHGDALVVTTEHPLRFARKLWPLRKLLGGASLPIDVRLRLSDRRDLLLRGGRAPRLVRALSGSPETENG